MAIPQYRGKQTTATTGTGTVTLNAAASNLRSFQAALGNSAVKCRYVISDASNHEEGIGTYDGASPGTLSRDSVIASSNAGALVNFAAGTKDVFLLPDFDRPILSISGTTTLALVDIGNLVVFSGSSSATLNLPAVATVPPGSGFHVKNIGTLGACLTIDPNASETIDGVTTLTIAPGESAEIFRQGSAWVATGLTNGFTAIRRIVTAGSQAQIDFVLPSGFDVFMMQFRRLSAAAGTPDLLARVSTDGGVTFVSSASSYGWGGLFLDALGAPAGGASGTATSISLHSSIGNTSGDILIYSARDVGAGTVLRSTTGGVRSGVNYVGQIFAGQRLASEDNNAVRLLPASSTFADGGVVTLLGLR